MVKVLKSQASIMIPGSLLLSDTQDCRNNDRQDFRFEACNFPGIFEESRMPGDWIKLQQVELYMKARREGYTQIVAATKAGLSGPLSPKPCILKYLLEIISFRLQEGASGTLFPTAGFSRSKKIWRMLCHRNPRL